MAPEWHREQTMAWMMDTYRPHKNRGPFPVCVTGKPVGIGVRLGVNDGRDVGYLLIGDGYHWLEPKTQGRRCKDLKRRVGRAFSLAK